MSDTKSILLIEDNDTVRRYYVDHLKRTPHYVVLEAVTGKTGLALYQSNTIDCVVLDLSLPDVSGFEVLAKLVPSPPHPLVPVVVLTSVSSQALLDAAKTKGAFAALQKDLTPDDELARVVLRAMVTIPVNGKKTRHPA